MRTSIFRRDGATLLPTELARGPWDAAALHGGAPAAILAGALERLPGAPELALARLTYEFVRPVPLSALTLTARVVRAGRRVQELEGVLSSEQQVVCQVRALRVRRAEVEDRVAETAQRMPGPDAGRPVSFSLDGSSAASFAASAMEMRWLEAGGVGELGPARVWMRLRHPLVAGEPVTPMMRLTAAADFGNGTSAVLPWERYLFINADLTVYVHRPPQGEWIGLDSHTYLDAGGAALAESVLHDEHGPVGRALQALVVQRR